jgi:hypothetical protein
MDPTGWSTTLGTSWSKAVSALLDAVLDYLSHVDWALQSHLNTPMEWIAFASIPIFTGVVGWLINWTGLIMLFYPVNFHGFKVPGMKEIARLLPRKLQEVPGILQGGIGWQGIVPARAAKMGSIAVDKAIAKLGTPAEFYQQLEPDKIAEHIVTMFEPDMPRDRRRGHDPRATRRSGVTCRRQARDHRPGPAQLPASSRRSPTRSASTSTSCSTRRSWSSTTSGRTPAWWSASSRTSASASST